MTQVTIHEDGENLVALLSGEIDHHWAAILREEIDERVRSRSPAKLILDFSGIGLILGRHRLVSTLGGVVIVQKAPREIKRMLSIAGIEARE